MFKRAHVLSRPPFVGFLCLFGLSLAGCHEPDPIVSYVIPTEIPAELRPGNDRMLGAMVPQSDQTWFFKVRGPESAVDRIAKTFRQFVETVQFKDGEPLLDELPDGWNLASGKKQFRFASINIETPAKQLDLSVSNLTRQEDWDGEVAMNINRWRGQLGLDKSTEKWASAEPIKIATTEDDAVWVDLVGTPSSGSPPMMSSMASSPRSKPESVKALAPPSESPQSRFKSEMPEAWRIGKKSSMRWASFNAGPEDSPAEVTVIPAGGDTRGNVKRWIGQVRADVTDEIVDAAMESAEKLKVGNLDAQRFILTGDDKSEDAAEGQPGGQSIDATIVPLEDNFSLFIKMTGPTETVTEQHDVLTSYLQSIEL